MKILSFVIATILLQLSVVGISSVDREIVAVSYDGATDYVVDEELRHDQDHGLQDVQAESLHDKKNVKQVGTVKSTKNNLDALSGDSEDSIVLEKLPDLKLLALDRKKNEELAKISPPVNVDNEPETKKGIVEYRVQSGDTLSSIWKKSCGSTQGVHLVASAIKKAGFSVSSIRAGETLLLEFAKDGTIKKLTKELSEGRRLILTNEGERYSHEIYKPIIKEKKLTKTGTIHHSLFESALQSNVSAGVIDDFIDLFGGRVEFSRDVQPGDRFSIVYKERHSEEGERLSPGPIEMASFLNGDEMLAVIRHKDKKGNDIFYDENGEAIGDHFLRYPLKFTRISSVFTKNRFHPVLKRNRPHNGVDFAAPTGTPVRSVADGIVVKSGYLGGGGNTVKIKHNGRYSTAYLHLSKISRGIRVGTRVKRGQAIGKVGSTGLATGPHLHYSLYDYGRYVDPMKAKLPKLAEGQQDLPKGLLRVKLELLKAHHEELQLAKSSAAHNHS